MKNFKVGNLVKIKEGFLNYLASAAKISSTPIEEDKLYTVIDSYLCKCGKQFIALLDVTSTGNLLVKCDGGVVTKIEHGDNHLFRAERFELATILDVALMGNDIIEPIPMLKELSEEHENFEVFITQESLDISMLIANI